MLTEMTEYWRKMQEEVKAMQSEIKKNIQGTNSEGKDCLLYTSDAADDR